MIGLPKKNETQIEIICEIASAHGGDKSELFELLQCATRSGANWVKLQIFQFAELVASDNQRFSDLKTIELSPEEWIQALNFVETLPIKLIVEPFDYKSFIWLKDHPAIDAFKIPTSDLLDSKFVADVLAEKKTVFIAVGGTKISELDSIMEFAEAHSSTDVVLLHGFQNFPTKLEDSLLGKISRLIERYNCKVGFADHIDASDEELARTLPCMAVAAGARVLGIGLRVVRGERHAPALVRLAPECQRVGAGTDAAHGQGRLDRGF